MEVARPAGAGRAAQASRPYTLLHRRSRVPSGQRARTFCTGTRGGAEDEQEGRRGPPRGPRRERSPPSRARRTTAGQDPIDQGPLSRPFWCVGGPGAQESARKYRQNHPPDVHTLWVTKVRGWAGRAGKRVRQGREGVRGAPRGAGRAPRARTFSRTFFPYILYREAPPRTFFPYIWHREAPSQQYDRPWTRSGRPLGAGRDPNGAATVTTAWES